MRSRLEVFDFNKGAQIPILPAPFLVDGVLHRSQTIIYGQTNSGKSMLASSLAVAVAGGQSHWCGRTVTSNGNVAIVSGDPDGQYVALERLDKVREYMGEGNIRIVVPKGPMDQELWNEVAAEVDGCKLVILDNLTQFVPTSLNDDNGVKAVYDQLQSVATNGSAVVTLAHASEKRSESGYTSDVPLGSTVIRTVPRWFVYVKRTTDGLVLNMSGNAGRTWRMTLSEPTDTPRFEVLSEVQADELDAKRQARTRQRSRTKLDNNAKIVEWMAANPEVPQRAAADKMTVELGFAVTQSTVSRALKDAEKTG